MPRHRQNVPENKHIHTHRFMAYFRDRRRPGDTAKPRWDLVRLALLPPRPQPENEAALATNPLRLSLGGGWPLAPGSAAIRPWGLPSQTVSPKRVSHPCPQPVSPTRVPNRFPQPLSRCFPRKNGLFRVPHRCRHLVSPTRVADRFDPPVAAGGAWPSPICFAHRFAKPTFHNLSPVSEPPNDYPHPKPRRRPPFHHCGPDPARRSGTPRRPTPPEIH